MSWVVKCNLPAAPGLISITHSEMRGSVLYFWAVMGNAILVLEHRVLSLLSAARLGHLAGSLGWKGWELGLLQAEVFPFLHPRAAQRWYSSVFVTRDGGRRQVETCLPHARQLCCVLLPESTLLGGTTDWRCLGCSSATVCVRVISLLNFRDLNPLLLG